MSVTVKDRKTQEEWTGRTALSVVRRIFGKKYFLNDNHNTLHNPGYRIADVVCLAQGGSAMSVVASVYITGEDD